MKKSFLFFGLFVFSGLFCQTTFQLNRTIEWADYFFINENYEKAIVKYLSIDDKLNIEFDYLARFVTNYEN